ncbi:MAG: hypothetical protein H6832_03255 [Planctomycetes bacterium]|nr:hypothetical protein [Planctomycetota bacterium]
MASSLPLIFVALATAILAWTLQDELRDEKRLTARRLTLLRFCMLLAAIAIVLAALN